MESNGLYTENRWNGENRKKNFYPAQSLYSMFGNYSHLEYSRNRSSKIYAG